MDILFQGSAAKYLDTPQDNEDAFNTIVESGRIVVCDGASESFDAKNWSRLLVNQLNTQSIGIPAISSCIQAYEELHDPASMGWAKIGAYERGSFSTALVVQEEPSTSELHLSCSGDTAAFLTDGDSIKQAIPYWSSSEFTKRPLLLSTIQAHNSWLISHKDDELLNSTWNYDGSQPHFLLCMTDALAAWLLNSIEDHDPNGLERLLLIRTEEQLGNLVESERLNRRMRRDDSTLIIARL